jgi:D-amino-acid dehydrogenase
MACTGRRSLATTEILLALAKRSQQALKELNEREHIAFSHRCNGKIVFYSTRASFEAGVRQRDLQTRLGSVQAVLTRDECLDLEPSLAAAARRLVGAIYTPSEEVGDCRTFCSELKRVLRAPPYGVEFRLGAEAYPLKANNGRLSGVQLAKENLEADLYVVCAGPGSRRLVLALGVSLPLFPIRGYSISAQIRDRRSAPEKSVTDYANRIVYARLGSTLRAAGFADIVAPSAPLDRKRIGTLRDATAALFPGACAMDEVHPWAGARPTTPTGVPLIGPTRVDNLLLNVGQGSLGFTLGAGSGQMIADIVAGRGVSAEGAFSELAPSRICEA